MDFYRDNARWLIGGFLLTFFSGFGQTFFISIWGSEIRQTFNLTHGGFGLIYMTATLASAALLPIVGRLVDVASAATTALIVITILAIAAVLMGIAQSLPILVLTIFLLRLFGQGMMTHTAMTAMGRWYVGNRGKAVSFTTIGHQFSEGLGPTVFVSLAAVYGWRHSWFIAAGILIVVALPSIVLLLRVERIPRAALSSVATRNEVGRQWTRPEMLQDSLFWLTGIGVFAPAFIGTSIFFHQDYLIEINGWPASLYYQSFALMAITTVLVSLTTGVVIDRWSAVQILPAFMFPLAGACFVLGFSSTPSTIFVFMILLGVSYGISSTLFGAIWPEIYGTRHLGSVRAITVSLMVFMSAAGPGVTGWFIDQGTPFAIQLRFLGVYCVICIGLMLLASQRFQRRLTQTSS